jgi:TolC family type I secretion outer membrane protein
MYVGAVHVPKAKLFGLKSCLYLAGFAVLSLGGAALAKDEAPPAPHQPWLPPGLNEYSAQLTNPATYDLHDTNAVVVDAAKIYDLPELIDMAERSHPQTRVAWEQARQAARAVGLSQSAYYPYLSASAAAGFEHGPSPVLTVVVPANAEQEDAALNLEWLLFDFGERKAEVTAARAKLMLANVSFNATHQQIVFNVTRDFYALNIARQKVAVEESSLHAAQTVGEATQARFDNGLATRTDLLQAQQETAQSTYDLESARGDLSDAQVELVDSLGILPTTQLQVAEVPEKSLVENSDDVLGDLMEQALAQRPELVAQLAAVRAAEASVKKARADFYPKISLATSAGWQRLEVNAYDSPYTGNSKPAYSAGVSIELPIFDGFLRHDRLRVAESELRAAQSQLTDSRDTVVREVWKAYTDFKTALHKQESAVEFFTAAQSAFDATLESYRHGLGTYVDLSNAQRNLDAARSVVVDTRAAIFTSSTALALSVGDLARPQPPAAFIRQQP